MGINTGHDSTTDVDELVVVIDRPVVIAEETNDFIGGCLLGKPVDGIVPASTGRGRSALTSIAAAPLPRIVTRRRRRPAASTILASTRKTIILITRTTKISNSILRSSHIYSTPNLWHFPKIGGPQFSIVFIIGTPKKVALILGNYPLNPKQHQQTSTGSLSSDDMNFGRC